MTESTAATQTKTIEITSEHEKLKYVRRFCREIAQSNWDENDFDDVFARLQLAVTEATTNVMRHAYDGKAGNDIRLVAASGNGSVTVDIEHNGKPFSPPDSVAVIEEPQEGGMGLYLIEQCVDRVEYLALPDGGQCIRLVIGS